MVKAYFQVANRVEDQVGQSTNEAKMNTVRVAYYEHTFIMK